MVYISDEAKVERRGKDSEDEDSEDNLPSNGESVSEDSSSEVCTISS